MSDTVTRTVIAVIAKTKKIAPEAVAVDATLEELMIDSLDGLNLFFELEEAFDIDIPDERARSMQSVRQIVEELERLLLCRKAANTSSSLQT